METKALITIFTPTFNRCQSLKRLYCDLKVQTDKDFVWLVIDDGSTDGTEEFFNDIFEDGIIEVRYIKKENGGKHTAYNLACQITDTELLFIAMDSDDRLKENAIKEVKQCWLRNKKENICGMVFLCENNYGKKLYSKYNHNALKAQPSWRQAYRENFFWGEAEYILRTDYAKQFLYPEYAGEKFFNEAYTYMQMDAPLIWVDSSIYIRDYQEDGLTKNFLKNIYKSPLGYADYNNLKSTISKRITVKVKAVLFYDIFSIIGKKKRFWYQSNNKLLSIILLPMAAIISFILYVKFKRGN